MDATSTGLADLVSEIHAAAVKGLLSRVRWHIAGQMDGCREVEPDRWEDTPLDDAALSPDRAGDGWTYLMARHPSGWGWVEIRGRLIRAENELGDPTLACEWELIRARDRREPVEVPAEGRCGIVARDGASVVTVDARSWSIAAGEPWIDI